jgi:hypothetical protein
MPQPEVQPLAASATNAWTGATAQVDARRSALPSAAVTERPVPTTADQRGAPDRRTRSAPEAQGQTAVAARTSGPPDSAAGAGSETTPPVIEVTIGRLEIRAEPAAVSRPAKPFGPYLDLAAYRAHRERGR